MRTRSYPLLAALLLALAGCNGSLLPKPAAAPALYRLTAANGFPQAASLSPVQLAVALPSAEAALDTTRIALSRSPTTLDYFADAAWTDRLPAILQARLVDSFDNAHRLVALAGEGNAAQSDAILAIALRHFEAQYDGDAAPHWRIELTADLISAADRKVIATRTFTGEAAAQQNGMTAIVDTADDAWRRVAKEIVDWATASLARPAR